MQVRMHMRYLMLKNLNQIMRLILLTSKKQQFSYKGQLTERKNMQPRRNIWKVSWTMQQRNWIKNLLRLVVVVSLVGIVSGCTGAVKPSLKAPELKNPPPRPLLMKRVKNPRHACMPDSSLSFPEFERGSMCLGGKAMKYRYRLHELQDYVKDLNNGKQKK